MFTDNDSDSSSRPKPGRNPEKKKARRRNHPSEQLAERPLDDMDFSPALVPNEIVDIEKMVETATPEQFQQLLALLLRKMMVRGLRDIPPPKSIKEMQVLFTMFRQAEGIEARDRGGGAPPAGFLPRMVSRKSMGSEDVPPMDAEIVEPLVEDDLFGDAEKEFEI
jgi:hypothetical protein